MILKIRTVDEGWCYYQINGRIKHRPLTLAQYENGCKFLAFDRREIDLLSLRNIRKEINSYDGGLKVIRFEHAKADNRDYVIYTNLTVYLLNDEGKTIERIN